ncbi:MAG: hypothetical protein HY558_07160 [Euryarchaeota archaeon]|nr:hypothetical protein [Euryarchaeota archaeon]
MSWKSPLNPRFLVLLAAVALMVLLSGCSSRAPQPPAAAPAAAPGASPPASAEVAIEVADVKFEPPQLNLKAGPTRFTVHNTGAILHEFVLYSEARRAAVVEGHKSMGGAGGHNHGQMDKASAILVAVSDILPQKTKESGVVTLAPGVYEYGCFVPGHYEAGMKGQIVVA